MSNNIKFDDLAYIRQGQILRLINAADVSLLSSINKASTNTQQPTRQQSALLMIHGFTSSPAVFKKMLPHLAMYDAILAPVLPGHGTNFEDFSEAKASDWIATVEQACASLLENYTSVDVLGLSLGGLLGHYLSLNFNIRHLYLLAPAFSLNLNITFCILLGKLYRLLGKKIVNNESGGDILSKEAEIVYKKLPLSAINEVLYLIAKYKMSCPPCKTDIFLGRHDKVINSKDVEKYFLGQPNINIHWLNQAAHVLPLEDEMVKILACIQQNMAADKGVQSDN